MAEFLYFLGFCVICDLGLLCQLPLHTCKAEVAPARRSWAGWAYGKRKLPAEPLFFKLRRNTVPTISISPPQCWGVSVARWYHFMICNTKITSPVKRTALLDIWLNCVLENIHTISWKADFIYLFLALGIFFIYLLISEGQYFSFRHISIEFIVYLLLYYFVVKKINTSFLLVFVSLE